MVFEKVGKKFHPTPIVGVSPLGWSIGPIRGSDPNQGFLELEPVETRKVKQRSRRFRRLTRTPLSLLTVVTVGVDPETLEPRTLDDTVGHGASPVPPGESPPPTTPVVGDVVTAGVGKEPYTEGARPPLVVARSRRVAPSRPCVPSCPREVGWRGARPCVRLAVVVRPRHPRRAPRVAGPRPYGADDMRPEGGGGLADRVRVVAAPRGVLAPVGRRTVVDVGRARTEVAAPATGRVGVVGPVLRRPSIHPRTADPSVVVSSPPTPTPPRKGGGSRHSDPREPS